MEPVNLTKQQARRFLLAHQGINPPHETKGKEGVLNIIGRLGCIQFDPLNIVGRNPDLVLQARIDAYRPWMLEELLYKDRLLVDGWDKNMSIYVREDWPYFHRYREAARRRFGHESHPVGDVIPQIRDRIEELGPASSIDIDLDRQIDWAWGPTRIARAALESMYGWGELIIHHRVNTRKFYDFARKHLPDGLLDMADPNETRGQFRQWRTMRRIGGLGLIWNRAGDAWLGMPGIKTKERTAAIEKLLQKGSIIEVLVDGITPTLYMRASDLDTVDRTRRAETIRRRAAILAPLDNLLWDRRFVKELFGFEYVWEVYKPVADRQYGYYVLPILYGDRFIARFEPARSKENGALLIKNWWWEPGIHQEKAMIAAVRNCFKRFSDYLGTEELVIEETVDSEADIGWLSSKG